jgi:hypothetical protein
MLSEVDAIIVSQELLNSGQVTDTGDRCCHSDSVHDKIQQVSKPAIGGTSEFGCIRRLSAAESGRYSADYAEPRSSASD